LAIDWLNKPLERGLFLEYDHDWRPKRRAS
jgi:hypothetical protein